MSNKSLQRRVTDARTIWDAAGKAVYDWALNNGHSNTPLFGIHKVAPAELVSAHVQSRRDLDAAEDAAVAAGKAYRGTFGLLVWQAR